MDAQKFRDLCDIALASPLQMNMTSKESYEKIKEYCQDKNWNIRKDCLHLRKLLIFEHINNAKNLRPYFDIVSMIWDASNFQIQTNSELKHTPEDWLEIIKICTYAKESSNYFNPSHDHLALHKKNTDFSYAWKKITPLGIDYQLHNNEIFIDAKSFNRIEIIIDDFLSKIGGARCLELVFQMLASLLDPNQERYLLHRKTTQGLEVISPEYPWGYIIALAVNNIDKPGTCSLNTVIDTYKNFIDFLRDLVATFEIQPYVMWESMYVDPERIINFLQENVLYDNLISFFQFKKEYSLEVLSYISTNHSDMNKSSYGITLHQIFKVAQGIIKLSDKNTIKELSLSELKEISQISTRKLINCINIIFESNSDGKLSFPPSSEKIDHVLRPIINFKKNKLLLPSSITCLATLNAAIKQISYPSNNFNNAIDSKIGKYLENFLIERFQKSGIEVFYGDFKSKDRKTNGDCDLIITSPNYIYIFELKKKSLTRKAMSGEELYLIKDLGDSVMRSQSQCAKIEYVLLKDKELTLKNGKNSHTIQYNGNPIQKISLSLHDFGALQDSTVFNTILRLSVQTNFSSSNAELDSLLVNWRAYLEIFNKYNRLTEPYKSVNTPQFFDNSFMSIPQIMTILDGCKNIESFDEEYNLAKKITFSTRDFYKEYSEKRKLKNKR
ncbi:hypothetical protein [Rahnella sp. CFA14(1/10)]|uniref:hypothetical protein n=1 Tax=Rahnella sp. CFA14(1/10) TaxID=2511203 RepID=UPI00101F91D7|nr:hypothetical protein [Rahnella sp. CFA14(1/10)]